MTTEKYLQRLEWLENTIRSRQEKVFYGRSKVTNMVAQTDKDPVQTSPKDTMSEILADVADTDKELQVYVAEYKLIMSQVDTLTGVYSPALIYRRYAKGDSVSEIARAMHISRSTAYRVHREALEEFEDLFGKIYKKAKNYRNMTQFDTL